MTTGQWALGLMTGTVLDGEIDIALIRTDGRQVFEFGYSATEKYSTSTCDLLANAVSDAQSWNFCGPQPDSFQRAESALTEEQSHAVLRSLEAAGLPRKNISLIGFHGQTLLHRPKKSVTDSLDGESVKTPVYDSGLHSLADEEGERGRTLQLADGQAMAALTGIDVVHDFRSMDMLQGGQGAPLVPVYHRALLSSAGLGAEVTIVNLGGIANLTWWDGDSQLIAFDCGPANAPINDWVSKAGVGDYDVDGTFGLNGEVNEERLSEVLDHSYFDAPYPKSLDRNEFFDSISGALSGMSAEDGAALLAALCAAGVERSLRLLPLRPQRILLCGGGRHNKAIVHQLRLRAGAAVDDVEVLGWRGDALEAECFAYLATRVKAGLPTSFPSTTGCRFPVCGGVISKAR